MFHIPGRPFFYFARPPTTAWSMVYTILPKERLNWCSPNKELAIEHNTLRQS